MEGTAYTHGEYPMWVDLDKANTVLEGYPQAQLDRNVFAVIAGDANSKGIAFPTLRTIAQKVGDTLQNVKRSVNRLIAKCLLKIVGKEKKYKDIHPRNIYKLNKGVLRLEPDQRSSHFDAKKWAAIAARLKKFVSDAVDDMKQVAVKAAKSMAGKPRKRSKKQWKQWNNSYQNNSYRSYGYSEPVLSPEERQRQDWVNQLCRKAASDLSDAGVGDGWGMALRYMNERLTKTPEKYDSILQEAIEKFKDFQNLNCFETRVQLGLDPIVNNQSQPGSVSDVRLVSPGNEPMSLGSVLRL